MSITHSMYTISDNVKLSQFNEKVTFQLANRKINAKVLKQ